MCITPWPNFKIFGPGHERWADKQWCRHIF